jgi:hypothetical protein
MKTCQRVRSVRNVRRDRGLRAMRGAMSSVVQRGSMVCVVFVGVSAVALNSARADEWGCQVALCLSNSGDPEQYGECVPPIERLWGALRDDEPFPLCDSAQEPSQDDSNDDGERR